MPEIVTCDACVLQKVVSFGQSENVRRNNARNPQIGTRLQRATGVMQYGSGAASGSGDASVDINAGFSNTAPAMSGDPNNTMEGLFVGASSSELDTRAMLGLDTWAAHGPDTWSLPGLATYGAFLFASCAYFWIRIIHLPELGPYFKYGQL